MAREDQLITPFVDYGEMAPGSISYGLSSYSYDMRVGDTIQICQQPYDSYKDMLDPKDKLRTGWNFETFVMHEGFTLPPHSFALACSVETFRLPYDVLGLFYGKSTYMRCGLHQPAGLVQPGFHGQITLEFANVTPLPIRIYKFEGIAQLVFVQNEACNRSYMGQFYGQTGVRFPNS